MTTKDNKEDKLLNQFSKWFDKKVFIEINSGRKYENIVLKAIDDIRSPVRFLNFENLKTNRMLCFVPSEIKRIEELK